jgi:hypothetical protein
MPKTDSKPEQPIESYPLRKMKAIVRRTELQVRIVFWIWIATIVITLAGILWFSIF